MAWIGARCVGLHYANYEGGSREDDPLWEADFCNYTGLRATGGGCHFDRAWRGQFKESELFQALLDAGLIYEEPGNDADNWQPQLEEDSP